MFRVFPGMYRVAFAVAVLAFADASTLPRSCLDHLRAGKTSSGVYNIFLPFVSTYSPDTVPNGPFPVYCDMTTDGGGWTLVSAGALPSSLQPVPHYPDLASLQPVVKRGLLSDNSPVPGLLSSLRRNNLFDIRFSCTADTTPVSSAGPRFDVDMSFNATSWYNSLTFGRGCFGVFDPEDVINPLSAPQVMSDLLTGETTFLNESSPYYTDFIRRSSCGSHDFIVDINGIDKDENDTDSSATAATSWGNNGSHLLCGASAFPAPSFTQLAGNNMQLPPLMDPSVAHPPGWFVWTREQPDTTDAHLRWDDEGFGIGKFSKSCLYINDETMFTPGDAPQFAKNMQEYDIQIVFSGQLAKYVTSGLEGPTDAVLPTLLAGKTCVIVPAMKSGASASGKSNFDVSTLLHPAEIGALQSFLASGGNIVQLALPNQRTWSFLGLFLDTTGSGPTRACVERAPRLNLATPTIANTEFVFAPSSPPFNGPYVGACVATAALPRDAKAIYTGSSGVWAFTAQSAFANPTNGLASSGGSVTYIGGFQADLGANFTSTKNTWYNIIAVASNPRPANRIPDADAHVINILFDRAASDLYNSSTFSGRSADNLVRSLKAVLHDVRVELLYVPTTPSEATELASRLASARPKPAAVIVPSLLARLDLAFLRPYAAAGGSVILLGDSDSYGLTALEDLQVSAPSSAPVGGTCPASLWNTATSSQLILGPRHLDGDLLGTNCFDFTQLPPRSIPLHVGLNFPKRLSTPGRSLFEEEDAPAPVAELLTKSRSQRMRRLQLTSVGAEVPLLVASFAKMVGKGFVSFIAADFKYDTDGSVSYEMADVRSLLAQLVFPVPKTPVPSTMLFALGNEGVTLEQTLVQDVLVSRLKQTVYAHTETQEAALLTFPYLLFDFETLVVPPQQYDAWRSFPDRMLAVRQFALEGGRVVVYGSPTNKGDMSLVEAVSGLELTRTPCDASVFNVVVQDPASRWFSYQNATSRGSLTPENITDPYAMNPTRPSCVNLTDLQYSLDGVSYATSVKPIFASANNQSWAVSFQIGAGEVVWLGWQPGETKQSFASGWSNSLRAAFLPPQLIYDTVVILADETLSDPLTDSAAAMALAYTVQGHDVDTIVRSELAILTSFNKPRMLIVPKMSNPTRWTRTELDLLSNYVRLYGGHLVFHGDFGALATQLMNVLFGYTLISNGICGSPDAPGARATLDASQASGTPFSLGPAQLSAVSPVYCVATSSLPSHASQLYTTTSGGTWLWSAAQGYGRVSFMGLDFTGNMDVTSNWVKAAAQLFKMEPGNSYRRNAALSMYGSHAASAGSGEAVLANQWGIAGIHSSGAFGTIRRMSPAVAQSSQLVGIDTAALPANADRSDGSAGLQTRLAIATTLSKLSDRAAAVILAAYTVDTSTFKDPAQPLFTADAITSAAIVEGFTITYDSVSQPRASFVSSGRGSVNDFDTVAVADVSSGFGPAATWVGTAGGLTVSQLVSSTQSDRFWKIAVTLRNTGKEVLRNVKYMRTVNPNQEYFYTGSGATANYVRSQVNDTLPRSKPVSYPNAASVVLAEGVQNRRMVVGYASRDPRSTVTTGGSSNRYIEYGGFSDWLNFTEDAPDVSDSSLNLLINAAAVLPPGIASTFEFAIVTSEDGVTPYLQSVDTLNILEPADTLCGASSLIAIEAFQQPMTIQVFLVFDGRSTLVAAMDGTLPRVTGYNKGPRDRLGALYEAYVDANKFPAGDDYVMLAVATMSDGTSFQSSRLVRIIPSPSQLTVTTSDFNLATAVITANTVAVSGLPNVTLVEFVAEWRGLSASLTTTVSDEGLFTTVMDMSLLTESTYVVIRAVGTNSDGHVSSATLAAIFAVPYQGLLPSVCSVNGTYFNGWNCTLCTVCEPGLEVATVPCGAYTDTVCEMMRSIPSDVDVMTVVATSVKALVGGQAQLSTSNLDRFLSASFYYEDGNTTRSKFQTNSTAQENTDTSTMLRPTMFDFTYESGDRQREDVVYTGDRAAKVPLALLLKPNTMGIGSANFNVYAEVAAIGHGVTNTTGTTIGRVMEFTQTNTTDVPKFRFSLYSSGGVPSLNVTVDAGGQDIPSSLLSSLLDVSAVNSTAARGEVSLP